MTFPVDNNGRCAAVTRKAQSVALWTSGAYGNRLRSWSSFTEYRESGFAGRTVIRWRGPGFAGPCIYNIPQRDVEDTWRGLVEAGTPEGCLMLNEAAPDDRVVVQGELWSGADNWFYFLHSTQRLQMRQALAAESRVTTGLRTQLMLRSLMSPSSWEDLQVLLEVFPDHVVELSVYEVCLGGIPGRNTLVWEVRRY